MSAVKTYSVVVAAAPIPTSRSGFRGCILVLTQELSKLGKMAMTC